MGKRRQTVGRRAPARRREFGEHGADRLRLGLEQGGQVERKGAEADAETLQHPPLVAAQRADVLVRPAPVENAGLLDELIGDAPGEAPEASVGDRLGQAFERREPPARFARDEGLEPPGGALARGVVAEIRR